MFGFVIMLALVTGCVANDNVIGIASSAPASPTFSVTQSPSLTSTAEASPTPDLTATLADTKPVWEIMENWSPANQVRAVLIDQAGDLWAGGPAGVVHWDLKTKTPTVYAIHGEPENTNVVALSQTPDGAIWAGTFGNGLARFDGKNWKSFTTVDGVPGNYIVAQTVTSRGELWFTTQRDQYSKDKDTILNSHFVRFDGNSFITEEGIAFDRLVTLPDDSIVSIYNEPPIGGVFFHSQISIYDGQKWNDLGVYPDGWIDAITVAPDGVIWFATRDIVYRYKNQVWKEITPPWGGKDFASVSSIAVSKDDIAWFGFSHHAAFDIDRCGDRSDYDEERGVYRYDGKTWTHFTTEDGLIDNKICAVTLDSSGNMWFGSFDKGVSRFDGETWTSYIIP
jgi:ligand-binding sensor domain-containing protein